MRTIVVEDAARSDLQKDREPPSPKVIIPTGFELVSALTERAHVGGNAAARRHRGIRNDRSRGFRPCRDGRDLLRNAVRCDRAGDLRGRGLGDVLMAAIVDHANLEHVHALTLQCRDDMIGFYELWRFEVHSPIPSVEGGGAGARMILRSSEWMQVVGVGED